ncbi:MAG TPA: hypothetical protein VGM94_01525, partial [Galbitalea sp.]
RAIGGGHAIDRSAQDADSLAHDLGHLLAVVAERFGSTGEWPLVEALRHQLDRIDDDLDVPAVAKRMPVNLGGIEIGYQGRIHLTLHGLAVSGAASQELGDCVAVVQFAYSRYREVGPGATITSAELHEALGLDELRLAKVSALIQSIPGMDGGGGSTGSDWHRILTSDITRLKRVDTVEDLLALVPLRRGYNEIASEATSLHPVRPTPDRLGPAGTPPTRLSPEALELLGNLREVRPLLLGGPQPFRVAHRPNGVVRISHASLSPWLEGSEAAFQELLLAGQFLAAPGDGPDAYFLRPDVEGPTDPEAGVGPSDDGRDHGAGPAPTVIGRESDEPVTTRADVLVVTVTKVEHWAVLDAFAAVSNEARPVTIASRLYRDLGIVNGARVLLGLSEMGSGGVGGAQQSVSEAIAALGPSAVLMVGIAFGADKKKQAIGDVLVSQQLSLYELQRRGTTVILRGDRPHASRRLLDFCRNVAFAMPVPPPFDVHFGPLLTGEKLIDDAKFLRQLLAKEREAIGGDMEAGGLYVACHEAKTDWIVIKGICDWADGNKSNPNEKEHQALAAKNAASFALRVLQSAAFAQRAPGQRQLALTEREQDLLLRLYDFEGTCVIRRARGEPESLWVLGTTGDMQWGGNSEDDRLAWLYVVESLLAGGLLEPTSRQKEYRLSERGRKIAYGLSQSRARRSDG